jgi:hypothetical protein
VAVCLCYLFSWYALLFSSPSLNPSPNWVQTQESRIIIIKIKSQKSWIIITIKIKKTYEFESQYMFEKHVAISMTYAWAAFGPPSTPPSKFQQVNKNESCARATRGWQSLFIHTGPHLWIMLLITAHITDQSTSSNVGQRIRKIQRSGARTTQRKSETRPTRQLPRCI